MDDRQKISVVLTTAELARFNSYCIEKGHKKSTLIKRLIREHLDREGYHAPDRQGQLATRAHPTSTPHGGRSGRKAG